MQINDYLKLVHFRNDLFFARADFDIGLSKNGLSNINDKLISLEETTLSSLILNVPKIKQLTASALEEIATLPDSELSYIYRAIIENSINQSIDK